MVMARAVGLKPEHASESPRGLVKMQVTGSHSHSSAGRGRDPRICISNKFPGEATAAGLEALENHRARDVGPTRLVQTGYLGEI